MATCGRLYKTTGITEVTIPDPPDYPPIKTIPKLVITGNQIPSPYDGGNPFGGRTAVGTDTTPYSTPVGSGIGGGGDGCDVCCITLPEGVSRIQIPPGCCRVIIIIG